MFYKVLIVEDEDIIRNGIKYSIDWNAYNAHVVGDVDNALEAIEMMEDLKPDILIVDINMPVKSGLDLIRETKDTYGYSSIIISGYNDFNYAQDAMKLDVVRYISKPINTEQLIEALQSAIKKQKVKQDINLRKELKENGSIDKHYNKLNHDSEADEIITYIHQNYHDKIQLLDAVESIGLSESTINSRLKDALGTTFNQYLNYYRIQKAISEIENNPNINLQALSKDVGIPNYKHFSYVFKKETGFSPREYILKRLT